MPTNFYGFVPERKRRGDTITKVGSIVANTITAIPGLKREADERKRIDQQREGVAKAILEDTSLADTNYKTWKETLSSVAKPLIEAKKMDETQLQAYLNMVPQAKRTDLLTVKSIGDYFERFSNQTISIYSELNKARNALMADQEKATIGKSVQGAIAGKPAKTAEPIPVKGLDGKTQFTETAIGPHGQPTVTPAIPEATNRTEASKRLDPSISSKEAESVPAYKELRSQADIDKSSATERRAQELASYRKKMLDRGYKNDKIDNALDNLEFLEKKRNADIRAENSLDREKRALTSFLNKVRKGDQLDPEEQMKAESYGIDMTENLADSEAMMTSISRQIKDVESRMRKQKTKSGDTENAYDMLLDNPDADIHKILKEGKITTYQNQPERQLDNPPALGGGAQIGKGRRAGIPKPAPIPTPQLKQRTPEDEIAIKWANEMLKTDPTNEPALRTLRLNGLLGK